MLLIPCYVYSPLGEISDNQRAINWSVYLFPYLRHIFKIKVVTSHGKLPYNSNYPDDVNLMGKNPNTTLFDGKRARKKLAIITIYKKLFQAIHSYIHIVTKWQNN